MKSKASSDAQQKGKFKKKKFNSNLNQESETNSFEKIQETRRNLPIYSAKERLQTEIRENSSLVIIGETGSGKTTQIPQFVYEEDNNSGIAITQPRRIAAIRFVLVYYYYLFIW
jgi:HrpA-like RNA helicase